MSENNTTTGSEIQEPVAALVKSTSALQEDFQDDERLYNLVADKSWHYVVRHCHQKGPREKPIQSQHKRKQVTALYACCLNRPPVQVVRAILQAYPEMALAPSMLKEDDDDDEEEEEPDQELPLHAATRGNASLGVLRELVKNHPQAACCLSSGENKTPVGCLWDARVTTESTEQQENYNTVFWQKMHVLLQAVASYRQQQHFLNNKARQTTTCSKTKRDAKNCYILEAAVYLTAWLDGPLQLVEYALEKYPEQVGMRNELTGELPLHIAVRGEVSRETAVVVIRSGGILPRRRTPGVVLQRHHETMETSSLSTCAIQQLLEVYPEAAASKDPNEPAGRYPLHTALLHQHTWYNGGIKDLLDNAPEALYYIDAVTDMYAFQMAACAGRQQADLDTIYCLLRAEPGVLNSKVFCGGHWLEMPDVKEAVTFYESFSDCNSEPSPAKPKAISVARVSPPVFRLGSPRKKRGSPKKTLSPMSRSLPKPPISLNTSPILQTEEAPERIRNSPALRSPRQVPINRTTHNLKAKEKVPQALPSWKNKTSQKAIPNRSFDSPRRTHPRPGPPLVARDPTSFYEQITGGSDPSTDVIEEVHTTMEIDEEQVVKSERSASLQESITLFEDGNASFRDINALLDQQKKEKKTDGLNESSASILDTISIFEEGRWGSPDVSGLRAPALSRESYSSSSSRGSGKSAVFCKHKEAVSNSEIGHKDTPRTLNGSLSVKNATASFQEGEPSLEKLPSTIQTNQEKNIPPKNPNGSCQRKNNATRNTRQKRIQSPVSSSEAPPAQKVHMAVKSQVAHMDNQLDESALPKVATQAVEKSTNSEEISVKRRGQGETLHTVTVAANEVDNKVKTGQRLNSRQNAPTCDRAPLNLVRDSKYVSNPNSLRDGGLHPANNEVMNKESDASDSRYPETMIVPTQPPGSQMKGKASSSAHATETLKGITDASVKEGRSTGKAPTDQLRTCDVGSKDTADESSSIPRTSLEEGGATGIEGMLTTAAEASYQSVAPAADETLPAVSSQEGGMDSIIASSAKIALEEGPPLVKAFRKISASDMMKRRATLQLQKEVEFKRKLLESRQLQGKKRAGRHRNKRIFMEDCLRQKTRASNDAVSILPDKYTENVLYMKAVAGIRKELGFNNQELNRVKEMEAELVHRMHLMLAIDRQLSLLKKQNREIKRYLLRCEKWLQDHDDARDGITSVGVMVTNTKFLYEEILRTQNEAIARFTARPQDFMASEPCKAEVAKPRCKEG